MEPTVTATPLTVHSVAGTPGTWTVCLAGALVIAPVYLLMRAFVKLVRQAYGFEPVRDVKGPPLRICPACHNTVLEKDFSHCPYCGTSLPTPPEDDIMQAL